jgi:hypothetical protein
MRFESRGVEINNLKLVKEFKILDIDIKLCALYNNYFSVMYTIVYNK